MTKKQKETERAEAIARLREILKPGDTVFASVKHVARSGMSRSISFYRIQDNDVLYLSRLFATALGWPEDHKHEAVKVAGCGMDMCFHTVYCIGRRLFPEGGPLPKSTPTRQHQEKAKGRETDGGYLLQYRSL